MRLALSFCRHVGFAESNVPASSRDTPAGHFLSEPHGEHIENEPDALPPQSATPAQVGLLMQRSWHAGKRSSAR
jgi:hypothetical protein